MVARPNSGPQMREKLEQEIDKVQRKLEELADEEQIRQQLETIRKELTQVESALAVESAGEASSGDAGARIRLEVQRERLLAQAERFEIKMEMRAEKRERLQQTLEELQKALGQLASPPALPAAAATTLAPPDLRKTHNERRKILQMVQEGKISPDEAARLLDALLDQAESMPRKRKPRWVRIRVTDLAAQRVRVNLMLPVGLVRAGLRVGGNIAWMEGVDTGELEEMLNRGQTGYILDMQDAELGERVEIFIE